MREKFHPFHTRNGTVFSPACSVCARYEQSYRAFVQRLFARGVNFHPDNPFEDYENEKGERTFTDLQVAVLKVIIEQSFKHLGDMVYTVGLEELRKRLGE